jgi:spermidine synthase
MSSSSSVVARAQTDRGEIVLRHRPVDGALELRVNGVFVMDDHETTTERLLARMALLGLAAGTSDGPWRVLIGGLGLGYTLAALLDRDEVGSVLVAEIEPDLVGWHRSGLIPGSRIADTRVDVRVADVRQVVPGLEPGSVDLILLDVDNGPGFLVYDDNADVYRAPFLIACRNALTPSGRVAVWSADTAPALTHALDAVFASSEEHAVPVTLGTRDTTYHISIAPRSPLNRELWPVEP